MSIRRIGLRLVCLAGLLIQANICLSAEKTITVSPDGSADCKTVQEAIALVPDKSADRTVIHIKAGTYQGQFVLPKDKNNVTFIGDDVDKTILTYNLNTQEPYPDTVNRIHRGVGTVIQGTDFIAENITFQNTSGDHGQAIALRVEGDRAIIRKCKLLGWQDTLMCYAGRQYYDRCYIEGRVDFIYGSGTALFEQCVIHSKNGGYVTAASTPQDHAFGFVFLKCKLTGDDIPWKDPAATQPIKITPKAYLGRPWRPFASVAFIECELGDHIRPEGWENWRNPENEKTARYYEYKCSGPGANIEKRVTWSKQLTPEQAQQYTRKYILGGNDDWAP